MKTKSVHATDFVSKVLYESKERPGYNAWASLFQFGNGELGISFNEIRYGKPKNYTPMDLDFCYSMAVPCRTCVDVLPKSNPEMVSEYVYMKSSDMGKTWDETGRCEVDTRHYYTLGYPDGRMVRLIGTNEYRYEIGKDRHCSIVEESFDGGNTWRQIACFLEGYFFYGHKFKKLRDGSIIAGGPIVLSFGPDGETQSRDTALPNVCGPMQSAFMHSADGGYTWTGPHYILPGIEALEPDFVELPDGSLLFINSTVQAGKPVRQTIRRNGNTFINGPLFNILKGSAVDGEIQGGNTPETIAITDDGLIVGARRNCQYTCSYDFGENWYVIENAPNCNYQPMIEILPGGRCMAVWHTGGDTRFGEFDMCIGTHEFEIEGRPPKGTQLTIERKLAPDGSRYINAYKAKLTSGEQPVVGQQVEFRYIPLKFQDGTQNPAKVRDTGKVIKARTDKNGIAIIEIKEMDRIPEIHFCYRVTASFCPDMQSGHLYETCDGPTLMEYAMTPSKASPANYPIYFICCGLLMITPETAEKFPELLDLVSWLDGKCPDMKLEGFVTFTGSKERAEELVVFLSKNNIITLSEDGTYIWYRSMSCPQEVLSEIRVCPLKEYFK